MTLKRGFKTKVEKQAASIRQQLGLKPTEPLFAEVLLKHLQIPLITPHEIPGVTQELLHLLLVVGRSNWWAATIPFADRHLIVYNPTTSKHRRESDLMHEVSHLLCGHQPTQFLDSVLSPLRTCDKNQEDEANWSCGCLKLPREGMLWAVKRSMTNNDISEHFFASLSLVRFRRNITGVDRQVSAINGKKSRFY